MTQEEVKIRTGIDNTAIAGGLRDLNNQVRLGAQQASASLNSMTNTAVGGLKSIKGSLKLLKLAFIADMFAEKLDHYMHMAKDLGTFWGAFIVGGEQALIQIQKNANAVEALWKWAKKTREAFAELGKAEAELDKSRLDQAVKELSAEDRLRFHQKQIGEARDVAANEPDPALRLKAVKLIQELEKEIARDQKDVNKENEESLKKQLDMEKKEMEISKNERDQMQAYYAVQDAKANFMRRQLSEFIPSLNDVANNRNSIYQRDAQDYLRAQQQAKQDVMEFGVDSPLAKQSFEYANKLRAPLEKAGFLSPQETMAEATKASEKHLETLVEKNDSLIEELETLNKKLDGE